MEETLYTFNMIVTYKRYYNEDSMWGTYGFATNDDIPHYYVSKKADTEYEENKRKKSSMIAGKMQELTVGMEYETTAKYVHHPKYGDQYEVISVKALIPKTKKQQLNFLKAIISEQQAERLIEVYPNVVEDVTNGKLDEIDYDKIKGVGKKNWETIKDKIFDNYQISDLISELAPYGITMAMINRLAKSGESHEMTLQRIKKNPYYLTSLKGIGFRKCDDIAMKIKPELVDSIERLTAFIKFYLKDIAETNGHTWIKISDLDNAVSSFVPECYEKLNWLLNHNEFLITIDNDYIGLEYYARTERSILYNLRHRACADLTYEIEDNIIEQAIREAEKEQGFQYVEEQLKVIRDSLKRNVSFITGKAGTGKTSVMRAILRAYTLSGKAVAASALSAMAAQRISEATGMEAKTIHRTLEYDDKGNFAHNDEKKLKQQAVFLDEGSMVNSSLFKDWLSAIDENARIIVSGDYKQLPPIGFGNTFSDLIHLLPKGAVSELTKPMRQAEKSGILVDANLIRDNINPVTEKEVGSKLVHGELQDMYYMFRKERDTLYNIAIKTFINAVETDGLDEVVIAVPRKQGCKNSAEEINKELQELLLPMENKYIEDSSGRIFKCGARVMQTVNNYDSHVFNGDIGTIVDIVDAEITNNGKTEVDKVCVVKFENTTVTYQKSKLRDIDLAYAMTVHKLQGAGRKTVIGIIDNTHFTLLDNCMLYTMLTRAKKRCLLLAEPTAFLTCLRTSHNRRNTFMKLEDKH